MGRSPKLFDYPILRASLLVVMMGLAVFLDHSHPAGQGYQNADIGVTPKIVPVSQPVLCAPCIDTGAGVDL